MNKIVLPLLFSLFSMTALAQEKKLKTLKASLETFRLALLSGDKEQLTKLTTAELSYGHSSGLIETKEQFVEKLASGKSDFVSIELSNETISMYKNAAVVRHELNAATNDSGKAGTVRLKVVLCWIKSKAGWQLAARQAVKIQ